MRYPGALALLVATACSADLPAVPCPGAGACLYGQSTTTYEVNPVRDMDLLVVMDDSASMAGQQEELLARLAPEFLKVPGGLPELRVRVIGSSVPSPGLLAFPGCAPAGGGPPACLPAAGYLEATQRCGQQSNYGGPFTEAFTCAGRIGSGGCGWEQPLAAARAALEGDPQDGSRFLRRDAFLAIIIITDEDDCSAPAGSPLFGAPPAVPDDPALAFRCQEAGIRCAGRRLSETPRGADLVDCVPAADGGGLVPVEDYVQFLRSLKRRPDQQLIVSVVAGWPAHHGLVDSAGGEPALRPLCARNGRPVLPAVRLRAFVEALANQAQLVDLCDPADPVEAAVARFFEKLAIKLGYPCLPDNVVDGDPALPGVQPSCVASESIEDYATGQTTAERPLPACGPDAGPPCWSVREDPYCLAPQVDRGGCLAPGGTRVVFRCAVAPAAPAP